MAKKATRTRRTTTTNGDILRFCAFWGMAVAAVLYLVSGVINFIAKYAGELGATLQRVCGILSLLGNIAIIIAIAFPAYSYVRGKNRTWKILFWILLGVFVLGVVFGAIPSIM